MKTYLHRLNQKGTTLVEIVIVMGLLSALLIIMATIFTSAIDTQVDSTAYSATLGNGRFIMARLDYDIARASAITTPAALGASSSSLVLTIGGTAYTYQLDGDNLELTAGSDSANLNSDDVTVPSVQFEELGNSGGQPTIRYSFTVTSTAKTHGSSDTQTFTSTAGQRL